MDSIEDRLEQALDDSLRMTFPASDPIAVSALRSDLALHASDEDSQRVAGPDE